MTERERFERWWNKETNSEGKFIITTPTEYLHMKDFAWKAWQAAKNKKLKEK